MTRRCGDHVGDWIAFETSGRVTLRVGKVEIGQGIGETLARIAAEELDVEPSRIDVVAGDTANTPDEGFTVGSFSVATSGVLVREAASAARTLFLRALETAGAKGPASVCDGVFTAEGAPAGTTYWSLASQVDLDQPPGDFAHPKAPADYRLVGRPGGGRALRKAVSGAAFIHDLDLPGMLHARMVRPPRLDAVVERMPDAPPPPGVQVVRDAALIGVLAAREEDAVRAAERLALQITWTPSEAAADPWSAVAGSNQFPPSEAAGAGGGGTIEVAASRRFLSHASIGVSCALALWRDGRLTVWTHSQGVFPLARALAQLLALDLGAIRMIHVPGSGAYGHNGADDVAADAAFLAMAAPGRPVRVLWTRSQELGGGPLGPAMRTQVSASLDAAGQLTRLHTTIVSYPHIRRPTLGGVNLLAGRLRQDSIPFASPPSAGPHGGADRNGVAGYDIADKGATKTIMEHPAVRTSALRSLGAHVNIAAIEAAMDEAAAAGGADPIAYRLRHLSDPRAREVLQRVAAMAGWPQGAGRGVGYGRYKNDAAYCAVIVEIELEDEVRVRRAWCAVDAGCAVDPDGVVNQIEGGLIQALSWTLKEATPVTSEGPDIAGWDAYPILRFDETPEVAVKIVQRLDAPSLGVGEAASGPTGAAVCNALAALTGVRIADFPLTRERIIQALA